MRAVLFTSASPQALRHLLWRLGLDAPEIDVAGVLYETARPPLSRAKRVRRFLRLLKDPTFRQYLGSTVWKTGWRVVETASDRLLRWVHAAPAKPNGDDASLESVAAEFAERNIRFHITPDLHDTASLAFVRGLDAEIGVIYGTRILKPCLFTIPRGGTINIHKHKLPDYRGCGAPGLWEMRDRRETVTVTVHRVVEAVDAGRILGERTIDIGPLDTLESIALKADVVSVDLIIDVLRDLSRGVAAEREQPGGGALYKGYQPHQVHSIERRIRYGRERWTPEYTRSLPKRLARTAMLPLLAVRNHRHRRRKQFPVAVLYHHLTSDRRKVMALPTDAFARHVRFLKKHYRIVSLHDAMDMLGRGEVDAPTVVLTFDDGYAENFAGLRAVAELERVPIAVCVCTQHVADASELAHDVERGERGFPSLDWDQVRYLDRHGITIASHTRTHFDCGSGDVARLDAEIAGSRQDLHEALGHHVDVFAFPLGKPCNASPEAVRLALRHYPIVLSAAGGANPGPLRPPVELRRFFHPDSLWELELQLQGILDRPVPPLAVPDPAPEPAVLAGCNR